MKPTDPLTVTLPAEAWDTVMRMLSEGPFRVVAGLINDIQHQCRNQPGQEEQMLPRPERPNGLAVVPDPDPEPFHPDAA